MASLYFGDNLYVLRDEIKAESIDLIYLDPPFNSKRDYNLLFKTPKGYDSDAQITAFDDTWHWGEQAEREFSELLHQQNTDVAEMIQALRRFLKESDMMAYLTMMANRLVELHRVLKPSGSLYLHCDPTASHYLKIVLDALFGMQNYRTEISWRRQSAHNDAKQGREQYGNVRDVIFFYTKSDNWKWNWLYTPYDESYVKDFYRYTEPETGRKYRLSDITAPGGASPEKRNPYYEFLGVKRYWRYSIETMEKLYAEGRIIQTAQGRVPSYKRYLDEMPGVSLQNDWTDIRSPQGGESFGYPTQKPLALLERIIQASSNEGDVVLDPFCGCGTAVHAAETLKREWIGVDITHLAISLIEKRMKDAFPGITFEVHGTPKDLDGAKNLSERNKYQFQWWACSLVNAQPYQGKKKGADGGIDGIIFFQDDDTGAKKIIISVKGGENVTRTMVADLKNSVEREKAAIGLFITLSEPTKPMITEAVSAGFYQSPKGDVPKIQILTIADLLSGKEKPQFYDMSSGMYNFKKAKVEKQKVEQKKLL
jgi:adenine specific DNA methylase Mod